MLPLITSVAVQSRYYRVSDEVQDMIWVKHLAAYFSRVEVHRFS